MSWRLQLLESYLSWHVVSSLGYILFALMLLTNPELDKVLQLALSRKDEINKSNIQDPSNQYHLKQVSTTCSTTPQP